jgi:tRNA-splicing ligase RtcB
MSYLQTDLPYDTLQDKRSRRALINKICEYVPYGTGTVRAKKQIKILRSDYTDILDYGASDPDLMKKLGIDTGWLDHLERQHMPADSSLLSNETLKRGDGQIGSIGSGNHFLEAQKVQLIDKDLASKWGISESVAFITHCGSRGLGHQIATEYFSKLWKYFESQNISLADKELAWAKVDSEYGKNYLLSMGCAANFAIVNHLVLNTAIKESLEALYPGIKTNFVYLSLITLPREKK